MQRSARSLAAEAAFRARVAELGGALIEPVWLGSRVPHRVLCPAGHENAPRPDDVLKGRGLCRSCSLSLPLLRNSRSLAAEAAFRARLAELGATVLEPTWLGVNAPHRVRCIAGHECSPRPNHTLEGIGICQACAGNDPIGAERAFRARIAELGGGVLEPTWRGTQTPHRATCAAGHECFPYPAAVQQGRGMCKTCVGQDSAASEAAFRARVAELGGIVLEPTWLGAMVPHRVRCANGHECTPRPNSIKQGNGLCRKCRGLFWDAFYIVTNDAAGRLKFGITSGDPRSRLAVHRKAGYRTVVRVLTGLPGTIAPDMERLVISALRLAKESPEHGREYFGAHVLGTVLDIIDHYPIPAARPEITITEGSEL